MSTAVSAADERVPTTSASLIDQSVLGIVSQFLGRESMLLDELRFEEWLDSLDEDIIYEVPLRIATDRKSPLDDFPAGAFRIRDDKATIRLRLKRSAGGSGWAEEPPSRTVRSVGSLFVAPAEQKNCFEVHSSLILYRQRGLDRDWDLIPARRRDVVRIANGHCKLLRRTVLLAETTLQTSNLGLFL